MNEAGDSYINNESSSVSRAVDDLRVLVIQPWLSYRGAETVSVSLTRELVSLGHDAQLVTVYVDDKHPPLGIENIKVIRASKIIARVCKASHLLYLFFGPLILLALIWQRSKGVDILNPHNPPSLFLATIVGRLRGIPVIWSCHSLPTSRRFSSRETLLDYFAWRLAQSRYERWSVDNASCIIVNSKRTAKELKKIYACRSVVIYPPLINYPWRSNHISTARTKHPRIIVVGRLDHRKNQFGAIEAFAHVGKALSDAELMLVGDGPLALEMKEYVRKLGLDKSVNFLGYVPASKLQSLYQSSHAALMPAFNEPWGLTPFEALSCGCLPIVSSQSGAAEVIKEEGIGVVCDPDPMMMARTIIETLRDTQKYQSIANKGKDYLKRSLTSSDYAHSCAMIFLQFSWEKRKQTHQLKTFSSEN